MKITYRIVGDMSRSNGRIQVLIAGKRVGDIHQVVDGGYRYFPKGSNVAGGKVFKTVNEVKASLEAE